MSLWNRSDGDNEDRPLTLLIVAIFLLLAGLYGIAEGEILFPTKHHTKGAVGHKFVNQGAIWMVFSLFTTTIGIIAMILGFLSSKKDTSGYRIFSWIMFGIAIILFLVALSQNDIESYRHT